MYLKPLTCPEQYSSVSWASSHNAKAHGTCLGFWFGPQAGCGQEATTRCFSPSLSPSLPLSQKNTPNLCLLYTSDAADDRYKV